MIKAMNFKKLLVAITIISLFSTIPATVTAQQESTQRIDQIQLDKNGNAIWTIEIREPLQDESDVGSFDLYIAQIEDADNNQTTQRFENRFSDVINNANSQYEREMSLESLSVSARTVSTVTGEFGITTVKFTWNNYGTVDDQNNIIIGEILSDGYTLSNNEKLVVKPPQSYETQGKVAGSEEIKDNALEWSGPYSFSDVDIIFEPSSSVELPVVPIGVSVIAIVLSLITLYIVSKNNKNNDKNNDIEKWNTSELKTEGEKIVDILENNGGRIKQKNLESKLDWSKSKISRVTSDLEEKNVIEKLTIGRENVLNLKKDAKEN